MAEPIRLGLILPSVNVRMEPEFYRVLPDGFAVHATRVLLTQTTPEALVKMEEQLELAATLIASVRPRAVCYACTSGSFIKGAEWDRAIMRKIEEICGCPAVTTSSAMVRALRAVGIKSVGVATPYIDEINVEEKRFLEDNGFTVPAIAGLQITDPDVLHSKTAADAYELAMSVATDETDGVFISCTDFPGLDVVERLEKATGRPAVSSNTASLWALLQLIGYEKPVPGCGRLLAGGVTGGGEL